MLSKTQIDKLGDRLRRGNLREEDLRALDDYRLSFSDAYDFIVNSIREDLQLEPTGRPAKSTTAIVEKLLRESIRLSQVQDIAGCRVVCSDMKKQIQIVHSLQQLFPEAIIVDRLKNPSHGYRAVHVIVKHKSRVVETQVRTMLQHIWAEFSEKLSDVFDPAIKYGSGQLALVQMLLDWSSLLSQAESQEIELAALERKVSEKLSRESLTEAKRKELIEAQEEIRQAQEEQIRIREQGLTILRHAINSVPHQRK